MKRKKESHTKVQLSLTLLFVVLVAVLFFLLDSRKNHTQQLHLQFITEKYQHAYNTIYDQYSQLATNIYSGVVERFDIQDMYQILLTADEEQKNRLREELHAAIHPRFEKLHKEAKVRHLHFHLQDNELFLCLHRHEKNGDNLTGTPKTIHCVNTVHSVVDGFEEGRKCNGYRFFFPITADDQTQLGNLEISFGPEALTSAIMKQYDVLSNFYISEDVVKRKVVPGEQDKVYKESHHKGYLHDINVLAALKAVSRKEMAELKPLKSITDTIYANAHSGQPMSLYDASIDMVFTTIPVLNPVTHEMTAFLTIRSQSDFFIHELNHFRLHFWVSLSLLLMVLSTFYLQYKKRNCLRLEIEERKRTALALSESEQRYRQIFETLADAMLIFNSEGVIVNANPAACEVYGYECDELIGLAGKDIVHSDSYFLFERFKQLKNEEKFHTESVDVRKDGTNFNVEVHGAPIVFEGETHLLAIVRDITERKQIEAELASYREQLEEQVKARTLKLKEQKEQLQAITENVPGVVFQFYASNTGETGVHYISPKLFDIFGLEFIEDSSLFLQTFIENIHKEDRQSWIDTFQEVAAKQIPWRWNGRYVKPSGEIVWFEVQSTPTVRENEIIFDGIFIDIKEKIEQEKQKLKSNLQKEQLRKLESLKTMAGAIAHHFNNAMMAVLGNLDLMKSTLSADSKEYEMASDAAQAARGASHVGSMMLRYVGQQPLKPQDIALETLVRECVVAFKSQLQPSMSLQITPPDQPLYCSIDHRQIKEVIESILTNAIEALGDATGTIKITFGTDYFTTDSFPVAFQNDSIKDGIYTFCQIKDTGHGIEPHNLARIFEPFFTTRFVGRGLGLALTVGIMRSHHGALLVESSPDIGTTVRVLSPSTSLSQPTPSSDADDEHSETVQLSGDILLADDEEVVLDVGRKMLEMLGVTVHTAINGLEAVKKIRNKSISFYAVVLDISMPEMDGIEAMDEIKKVQANLPIILSSGYTQDDLPLKRDHDKQPDGFLQKPFQLAELKDCLGKFFS